MASIRPINEAILQELALCRFLTIKQIRNRFFSHGSYTHVSTLLKHLAEDKYLVALEPPAQNQPYLYGLGTRGVQHLRNRGTTIRYYPSEHTLPSSIHLSHHLTTNDLLIASTKLCENTGGVVVVDRRHYATTQQKNRSVIPDAWVHLIVQDTHCAIWGEVDRGSEEQAYVTQKVLSILRFAINEHLKEFGIPILAVAFVTTKGASRLDKLVRIAETALMDIPEASFFRFTAVAEEHEWGIDPQELFFKPVWRTPFSRQPVTLW